MFQTTMMFRMSLLYIGASVLVRCDVNVGGFNETLGNSIQLGKMEAHVINKFHLFIQDQLSLLDNLENAQQHAREIKDLSRKIEHLTSNDTDLLSFVKKLSIVLRESGKFITEVVKSATNANITNAESKTEFEDAYQEFIEVKSELLCRGLNPLDVNVQKRLKCRYVDHGVPFLKIAPFKEEEVFLKPRIVLYHDVIYDEEIETIMIMAQPELKSAGVLSANATTVTNDKIRVAKTAWLHDSEHKHVSDVSRRVKLMTNLETDTADLLQVCHYKPGGFYKSHHDSLGYDDEILEKLVVGDRTATLMFYFNDVKEGGRTVFPLIGVSLTPRKASAAFWYNLLPNGKADAFTFHAGCPVLYGSKIVANKWLHEVGQEFRRPCTLENQLTLDDKLLDFTK